MSETMSVTVRLGSAVRVPEYDYVLSEVLGPRLGIGFQLTRTHGIAATEAEFVFPNGATLRFQVGLLAVPDEHWLRSESLPSSPCRRALEIPRHSPVHDPENLPLIGLARDESTHWWTLVERRLVCRFDLVSAIFFLLTRYEELINPRLDPHGRYPAAESLAFREGALDRPLADDYVDVFRYLASLVDIAVTRRTGQFSMVLTHDIDQHARWRSVAAGTIAWHCAATALKYRSPWTAFRDGAGWLRTRLGDLKGDPYYRAIYELMNRSEEHGLHSAFFFIPVRMGGRFDGSYDIADTVVGKVMKDISERGHEIGVHPSYESMRNRELLRYEVQALRSQLALHGIGADRIGGRQHYLRWSAGTSWSDWDAVGLAYDSSVYFPEHTGFRCGTCHAFRPFDITARRRLRLIEKPLVLMDRTLLNPEYMGLADRLDDASAVIRNLRRHCARVGGQFVVLWHNSQLVTEQQRELYGEVLAS